MSHGSPGWILFLAYVTSVVGSLIGLACAQRARAAEERSHEVAWTALGAVAIGGIAIWLMHFIAMLDFTIGGSAVTYSVPLTVLSAVLSILVVYLGLSIVTLARFTVIRLICAGIVAGIGVTVMHYVGMAAVEFQGELSYNPALVAVSAGIAIAAATVAFWFTLRVESAGAMVLAGLAMGVAVTGMHYTGMAAASVRMDMSLAPSTGAGVFSVVFPVFTLSALAVGGLLWALMASVPDPIDVRGHRPAPR
ncbi:MHYT domain-containing protein [Kutzneria sp. NPDC052558]|uniref:MHYT domain-containing protein n=1 Tax=Kutzneria sp. NPDC052558 TaxID=3364121 RepID=UPI0037CAA22F